MPADKATTCVDLNCNTSPNCSIAPACPLVKDRLVTILTILADKIDVLLVAFTGSIFAISAAIIVVGGHGEPPAVSLATMIAGFGLGIMAYFRLKAGQTATVKHLERVEKKADKAAEKATEAVIRTDETADTIIRTQTKVVKQAAATDEKVSHIEEKLLAAETKTE